jgi:hypothetical protein
MAEKGVWPRSEDGTEALALKGEAGMPNREHSTMKAVQVAGGDRAIHSAL